MTWWVPRNLCNFIIMLSVFHCRRITGVLLCHTGIIIVMKYQEGLYCTRWHLYNVPIYNQCIWFTQQTLALFVTFVLLMKENQRKNNGAVFITSFNKIRRLVEGSGTIILYFVTNEHSFFMTARDDNVYKMKGYFRVMCTVRNTFLHSVTWEHILVFPKRLNMKTC